MRRGRPNSFAKHLIVLDIPISDDAITGSWIYVRKLLPPRNAFGRMKLFWRNGGPLENKLHCARQLQFVAGAIVGRAHSGNGGISLPLHTNTRAYVHPATLRDKKCKFIDHQIKGNSPGWLSHLFLANHKTFRHSTCMELISEAHMTHFDGFIGMHPEWFYVGNERNSSMSIAVRPLDHRLAELFLRIVIIYSTILFTVFNWMMNHYKTIAKLLFSPHLLNT